MENLPPQKQERPDGVWFLVILYGIAVVINFAIVLFALLSPKSGQVDLVGLGILVAAMVLRGIGLVRLFFFKSDAWLYLALALFIIIGNDALDLLLGGTDFFMQRHSLHDTIIGVVGALAVIVYAYRLPRKTKSSEA